MRDEDERPSLVKRVLGSSPLAPVLLRIVVIGCVTVVIVAVVYGALAALRGAAAARRPGAADLVGAWEASDERLALSADGTAVRWLRADGCPTAGRIEGRWLEESSGHLVLRIREGRLPCASADVPAFEEQLRYELSDGADGGSLEVLRLHRGEGVVELHKVCADPDHGCATPQP